MSDAKCETWDEYTRLCERYIALSVNPLENIDERRELKLEMWRWVNANVSFGERAQHWLEREP